MENKYIMDAEAFAASWYERTPPNYYPAYLGGPIDDLFMNSEEGKRRRALQAARNNFSYLPAEPTRQPLWPIESIFNPLPIGRDPVGPISGFGQQSQREELPQTPNYSPRRRRTAAPIMPLTPLGQQLELQALREQLLKSSTYSPLGRDRYWPLSRMGQQLEVEALRKELAKFPDYSPLRLRRDPMWPNSRPGQQLESRQPRRLISETVKPVNHLGQHCAPPIYDQSELWTWLRARFKTVGNMLWGWLEKLKLKMLQH
ncbi:maker289 [Drosophila busckii]|uniref:Maker289 n=1 Tax=Drosophila busckii TaxID=30019 RepID=A0A0M4F981_DROBS|nr:uncharacterized protein LOC108605598 [Drosophila busckii]ALC48720.1 maker289 [Drosophila busckii]